MVMSTNNSQTQANISISVVIISCERPDYLTLAVDSVLRQIHQPAEIIIIDDCSKADYQPTLQSFSDERIIYHRSEQRCGANSSRNKGVELSSGKVLAFLDDDDIWNETFLKEHYTEYLNNAEAVICGYSVLGNPSKQQINLQTKVTEDELRKGNTFSGMSGFSALRDVLLEVQFDNNLNNGQDWDLFVRITQQKRRFVNIPMPLFQYRKGLADGITSKAKTMTFDESRIRLASAYKHREWLGENNFRQRVADQLLSFIVKKQNKLQWLLESIKLAGFIATFIALKKKLVTSS
jgi:glycosyltransferase involved in cell wall biosynthesis